jgi:hypothetical protein
VDDAALATTVGAVVQGWPVVATIPVCFGLVYVTNQNDSTVSVIGP